MAAPETVNPQNTTGTAVQVSEPEVQKALFTVLATTLPLIISAVNGKRKALEMEQAATLPVDAAAEDGDEQSIEKILPMIAATIASTVAQEVLPRALEFAKERLGGGRPGRPRHKAVEIGAAADDTEIEKSLLPDIWRLATTHAPQVISMLQQHAAAANR